MALQASKSQDSINVDSSGVQNVQIIGKKWGFLWQNSDTSRFVAVIYVKMKKHIGNSPGSYGDFFRK